MARHQILFKILVLEHLFMDLGSLREPMRIITEHVGDGWKLNFAVPGVEISLRTIKIGFSSKFWY